MVSKIERKQRYTKAAKPLFPIPSAFHEANGLPLRAIHTRQPNGSVDQISLDFSSKTLIIRADADDDTIEFWISKLDERDAMGWQDQSQGSLWNTFLGQTFGWGWVTINQQGYCDGILISFYDIVPKLSINVAASSLHISTLTSITKFVL